MIRQFPLKYYFVYLHPSVLCTHWGMRPCSPEGDVGLASVTVYCTKSMCRDITKTSHFTRSAVGRLTELPLRSIAATECSAAAVCRPSVFPMATAMPL